MRISFYCFFIMLTLSLSAKDKNENIFRDWYAKTDTDRLVLFDSIRMYSQRPDADPSKNLICWMYYKGRQFNLWLINYKASGIVDPDVSDRIKWKKRTIKGKTLITIKWNKIKRTYFFNLHYGNSGVVDYVDFVLKK